MSHGTDWENIKQGRSAVTVNGAHERIMVGCKGVTERARW